MDGGAKRSARMLLDVVEIQVIRLDYSLVGVVIALERVIVMMWSSSRSLLVSVSVLKSIFTMNLQSDSSVNVLHFLAYFGSFGIGVYETANFQIAQQYLFIHTT